VVLNKFEARGCLDAMMIEVQGVKLRFNRDTSIPPPTFLNLNKKVENL
jgi:hypothetical protein